MEKLTKKDIKGPDAFLSIMDHFSHWIYKHRIPVFGSVGAILLVGMAWTSWAIFNEHRETQGQDSLFLAEKKLKDAEDALKKAKIDGESKLEVDYKDAVPALKEVMVLNPDTQASVVASLHLAALYYKYQKYDEAIPLAERAAVKARHPVTRAIALDRTALSYEAKGDCNKAIENWNRFSEEKSIEFLRGQALIKTALCYEKLKQFEKAQQTYQKAENIKDDSDSGRTAKKYLRELKRFQNS